MCKLTNSLTPVGQRDARRRRGDAYGPPEFVHAVEALGGVDDGAGVRERRLARAEERLVAEHFAARPRDDGLVRHPERVERAAEAGHEPRSIADETIGAAREVERAPLGAREAMQADRVGRDAAEILAVDRLRQIAKSAVFDRGHRRLERRATGDEDDRDVEVVGADTLEKRDPAEPRHVDVAEDDVERAGFDGTDRGLAVEANFHSYPSADSIRAYERARTSSSSTTRTRDRTAGRVSEGRVSVLTAPMSEVLLDVAPVILPSSLRDSNGSNAKVRKGRVPEPSWQDVANRRARPTRSAKVVDVPGPFANDVRRRLGEVDDRRRDEAAGACVEHEREPLERVVDLARVDEAGPRPDEPPSTR